MRRGTDRRSITLGLLAAAGLLTAPKAEGREAVYPTRPVLLLMGFQPGGPLDLMARTLAEKLAQRLGQPFLVENRPGASSNLAAEAVARAAPLDGHLLLMSNHSSLAVNAIVQRDLSFDPARDLAPVAQITAVPVRRQPL